MPIPTFFHRVACLKRGLLLLALVCLSAHAADAPDAHLVISAPGAAKAVIPSVQPATKENVTIFNEPGRYGGWPANHGLWQWGDELVAGFEVAWFKHPINDHAVDRSKPFENWQARSLDGGKTWTMENHLPFTPLGHEPAPKPLSEPLDFTAPNFALMFRFGGLHEGPSWFYTSLDRCKTWQGPFSFAVEGIDKVCTRTDLIILGKKDCLMFGSAAKLIDGKEGRTFCARTTDGGLHWKLVSLIGPEPKEGYAIMPSTVKLASGALITTIRQGGAKLNTIAAWRSDDLGQHWTSLGDVTPDIGSNPPALVQLQDGRLCLSYGVRRKPFGVHARISADEGRTWGPEIILRDDGLTGDLGYPRSLVRPDGKIFTIYYFNGPRDEDRTIQGTFFTPPAKQADAAEAPGTLTNSIGMKLAAIAPGSFIMGQDGPATDYLFSKHPLTANLAEWDEKPAHKVTLTQPFHLGVTEVTVGQYRNFQPKHQPRKQADEAVTEVSWQDAMDFCQWLSNKEGRTYRLPTEAEWEYACRAGTTTLFNTGDALPAGFQTWYREENWFGVFFPAGKPLPPEYQHRNEIPSLHVSQTPANAWGLYDMHGNVAEWCLDWYGPYEAGEQSDPLGRSDGDFRVLRGGSHSSLSYTLRSANRSAWIAPSRNPTTGFRVVLGALPKGKWLPPAPPPLNAQNVKQAVPKIEVIAPEVPFFSGPKPFVKIAPDSYGPLYSYHNHSPAITECPNGDLLATWFSCTLEPGTELCNAASRLRFGASEWEEASPFWDGADVNDHAPKLWWDGDKTLFHFARGYTENIVRTSTDNGATWSKARVLLPHGELGNQLLRLRDGTLVFSHDSRTVSLLVSHDHGDTWTWNELAKRETEWPAGKLAQRYPGIHAPLVELADGRLMAFSRNDPLPDQEKFGFKTVVSYTRDLGKTWQVEPSEFPAVTSGQRQVMLRLREGPILLCSFTDQGLNWKKRQGLAFKAADGSQYQGYGLFAAVSFDDGKTWPTRRLITPGGGPREVPGTDGRSTFTLSETMAEIGGYLTATQTRDGRIQLLSSRNHYVFNLAWLKSLPPVPKK